MSRNSDDFFKDVAPLAARVVAESYVGARSESGDPTELIRQVIAKLPSQGRIRKKNERLIVKGLTHLIHEVPADSPSRTELGDAIEQLVRRST
jgi:hypothetical protein